MEQLEERFEIVYRAYYARIYFFLFKLCGDANDAETMTQETFLHAYTAMHGYRGQCDMFTWLAILAKKSFMKYLRHTKRQTLDIEVYVADPEAPVEEEAGYLLHKKADIALLRQAMACLPASYSDVLILRIYGDLSFSEIAAGLSITENSAKVIFFRAKKILGEVLRHA